MSTLILNIGLAVGNDVPAGQLVKSLKYVVELFIPTELRTEIRQSASEPTLVVELETFAILLNDRLDLLARALDQDAVAGLLNGEGFLIGPKAADWGGAFNPEFFVEPSWSVK